MAGYDRRMANRISLRAVIAIAAVLGVYFAVESAVDTVSVSDKELRVSSLFGFRVPLSDIEDLVFEQSPPEKRARIIGLDAFGLFSEGDFNVEGLGKTRVFIKRPYTSYVLVRTVDRSYLIGLGSIDKDQLLYDRIKLGMR